MYSVTIEGESLADLKKNVGKLSEALNGPAEVYSLSLDTAPAAVVAKVTAPVVEKKKAGRPKKVEAPVEVEVEHVSTLDESEVTVLEDDEPLEKDDVGISKDQLTEVLTKLTKKSVPAARSLLGRFDCQRLSDLSPKRYAEFLKACEGELSK